MSPNTDWFKRKFKERDLSVARVAAMMGLQRWDLHKRLHGTRGYGTSAQEAQDLARIMGEPVGMVMRNLGIEGATVPRKAADPTDGLQALAVPSRTPVAGGWTVFYDKAREIGAEALGHLVIGGGVRGKGVVLGTLAAIQADGTARIACLGGAKPVTVKWAAPVQWIKTA